MKHTFIKRAVSLLLALVCVMGILPLSAFAANGLSDAPGSITQTSSDYMYVGGRPVRYEAASSVINNVGRPYVFDEQVNVPGYGSTRALCAYQQGTLGNGANGQRWDFKKEVTHPSLNVLLTWVYSCTYGDFTDAGDARGLPTWGPKWSDVWFMVGQAMTWYYEHGILIDCRTDREGFIRQASEEFVAAFKMCHDSWNSSAWITDWDAVDIFTIIDSNDDGATGYSAYDYISTGVNMVLDHPEYFHEYHLWEYEWDSTQPWKLPGQQGTPMQRLLIAVPEPESKDISVSLTVKKLEAGTNKPLAGVTFKVENAVDPQFFSVTRTTGSDGTFTLTQAADKLTPGQYTITEIAAPAGYIAQTASQTVTVMPDGSVGSTFTFFNTRVTGSGSIRKVDADNPSVGIPGAVIKLTSVKLDDGSSFTGTYVTGDGGYIAKKDLDFSKLPTGTYTAQEITPPQGYTLNQNPAKMRQTFVWDGEHDVSLVFENDSKVKVQLKKVDESGSPLAGAVFLVLKDGQIIDTKTTDADGTITVPNVNVGHYEFVEAVAPEGFDRDPAPVGIRVDAKDLQGEQTLTVTKVNHCKRALTIEKKDAETGKPVSGAVFHVRGINVAFEQDVTTGADGKAVLKAMPSGCYEVTETAVPSPYLLDANNRKTVWIESSQDKDVTVTFTNSTRPGLRLVKTDHETGKPIAGVTFLIQQIGGGYSEQHVTDENGLIVLENLAPGAYTVTEVKSAPGYAADATPRTVWLEKDRTTLLELTNQRKPDLRILKYDRQSGRPLAGVTFEIWHDGELFDTKTTDKNGEIYLSGLDLGTYLVKEVATDDGHIVNSTPQQIELTAGRTETAQLVFFNALKPGIHLIKVDSVTMKSLPNVRFEFKLVGGSYRQEFVTDVNGEIDLSKLEPGAYQVRELAAPEGYLIDDAVRVVRIEPDQTANFIFTNTPKPSLVVVKYDPNTGKYLAGATFRIAKIEDGTRCLDRVTGTDGRIVLTGLEPGVYSVQELEAPAGYVKNETEYHVELAPGRTAQLVVNNEAKPDLKIVKTDAVTGEPVAGVTFTVKKADGSTITTEATDKSGEILLEDLDPGVYEIWEKSVPDSYLLNNEHQQITLVAGRTGTVRFQNYPKSELVVKKLDAVTGDPVKGAKFRVIYASNSTFSGEINDLGCFYSDEKGMISLSRLRDGWYKIEEVEPAPGYALADPAAQTVYVKAGTTKTVVFENTPLSALVVYKYDSVTGNAIKGAVFQVKYLGGTSGTGGAVIGTYRTSANGSFTVTGLKAGTYTVSEVASDSGHVIDAAPQTVFISGREQDVVTLYFGNSPRGALLVKKVDAATGKPLSGVEFFVTDSSGAVVGDANGKFVTDSSGSFTVSGVAPGTTLMVKETHAKPGYLLDDVPQTAKIAAGQTVTLEFRNQPMGNLIVKKVDSVTGKPLAGVEFKITYANGRFVDTAGGTLSSNGLYTTDKNGQIVLSGIVGTVVVTETRTLPGYAIDEDTRTQTVTVNPNDTQSLVFYNTPAGGVEIVKVSEADHARRIPGVTFEIRRMDGGLADTVTTDKNGRVYLPLDAGSYYAMEIECPKGFRLDPTPHYFTVKDGRTTALTVTNQPLSGIVIHKVDSATGKGIYGVTFVLYDSGRNPIGEYTSDQSGYVYIDDLTVQGNGRFYLRELEAAHGYVVDTQLKTVYVKAGETTLVEWQNAPATGQLQITKTSADYNSVNGWPAGSPIPGTVFEVYDHANNLMDTIQTDKNGVAVSKPLPLGRYKVVESQAADHYILDRTPMEAEIEFAGQIVRLAMTNKSVSTGVSITKTGYAEVLPGQSIRYTFSGIANSSNVSLSSFFWRDTLPVNAVRLDRIVTGTYSAPGWYKVVYKTNLSGGNSYLMYDSLSTRKSYDLNASAAALGLAANEYITEFSLVFGTVPAGFHQVESPKVDCKVLSTVKGGSSFTNAADIGGLYGGKWIQAAARWTTKVYGRPVVPTLPKTGY